jgi:hypothetical protein
VRDHPLSRVSYDVPAVSAVSPADVPGRAGEDWPEGEYACVGVRFAAKLEPLPGGRRHVAVYLRVRLDDHRAAVVDLRAFRGPAGHDWPGGTGEWATGPGSPLRVSATGLGGPVFGWLFGDVAGRDEIPGACAAYALVRVPAGLTELSGELRVDSSMRRPAFWRPAGGGGPVEHVRVRVPWRFRVAVPPLRSPVVLPPTPVVLRSSPAGSAAARDVPPHGRIPPRDHAFPEGRRFSTGPAAPGRVVPGAARAPDGGTRVRLCLAADMERFSRFRNPEAVRAQARLADALTRAREHAGLGEADVDLQLSGDGQFAVLSEHLDETVVIPLLVEGLRQALAEVNADLSEHARVRLRVAVHRGLTTRAGNGWVGDATIAVRRILDSPAAREALAAHPDADFVLIVPDALYRDVIGHGYGRLRPDTFHQVEATLPEKGFTERAWIHIPAT